VKTKIKFCRHILVYIDGPNAVNFLDSNVTFIQEILRLYKDNVSNCNNLNTGEKIHTRT